MKPLRMIRESGLILLHFIGQIRNVFLYSGGPGFWLILNLTLFFANPYDIKETMILPS